jgi:hypothetical protein
MKGISGNAVWVMRGLLSGLHFRKKLLLYEQSFLRCGFWFQGLARKGVALTRSGLRFVRMVWGQL